jgi:hypothetical protein
LRSVVLVLLFLITAGKGKKCTPQHYWVKSRDPDFSWPDFRRRLIPYHSANRPCLTEKNLAQALFSIPDTGSG